MEHLLTAAEVARYLKLSRSKVYYLIQRSIIPHIRMGRNVRIRESDLIRWLEQQTVGPNWTTPQ